MTKIKVLVVDDELIGRQLLQAVLIPEGFEVILAEDGEDAIAQSKAHLPNLILMDVMMPGMDGYETVKSLKSIEELNQIPVIMVTALDDRDSRIQGLEAGAIDYITKPFDRIEIITKIKNRTLKAVNAQDTAPVIKTNVESTNKSNQNKTKQSSLLSSLVSEILDTTRLSENFSGKIEIESIGTNQDNLLGGWSFKQANSEILCFFGPENPNEESSVRNSLINVWLWNKSIEMPDSSEMISNYIKSCMEKSDGFNLIDYPWWFIAFTMDANNSISAFGFNTTAYLLKDNSAHIEYSNGQVERIQPNETTHILKSQSVVLLTKEITTKIDDEQIFNELSQHTSLPNANNFNTNLKSLLETANFDMSFGMKIDF